MKKHQKIKKVAFSALLLALIVSISVSDASQNVYAYKKAVGETTATFVCSKGDLKFVEKVDIVLPLISNSTVEVRTVPSGLDTYVDENNNTYYYLSGTDTLCGFQKEKYYGFKNGSPVSQEEAIQISSRFLKSVLDEFDEYTLIFSEYVQSDAVYHIQYSYCINNIPSDDLINIFIQENGEVGAFLAMRRGLYKNIVLSKEVLALDEADEVVNRFISLTNEGLVIMNTYKTADESNTSVLQQEVVLIPCEGDALV